jgi:hypothetical protein
VAPLWQQGGRNAYRAPAVLVGNLFGASVTNEFTRCDPSATEFEESLFLHGYPLQIVGGGFAFIADIN